MSEHENMQRPDEGSVKEKPEGIASRKQARQRRRPLPPWKVILHNDDKNDIGDVIKVVCRLTPLNSNEAEARTMEAHHSGAAMLLVTHQERAELYVDQFASCGLTATAEPDA